MKFICLGYYIESNWASLAENERNSLMDDCCAYDDVLRAGGHFVSGEGLESANSAKILRLKQGAVNVTDGPFSESKEVLGGFLILEARDRKHAVELISKHPGLKAGPFEIRAIEDMSEIIQASKERRRAAAKGT